MRLCSWVRAGYWASEFFIFTGGGDAVAGGGGTVAGAFKEAFKEADATTGVSKACMVNVPEERWSVSEERIITGGGGGGGGGVELKALETGVAVEWIDTWKRINFSVV
jgi:hypothetical protein